MADMKSTNMVDLKSTCFVTMKSTVMLIVKINHMVSIVKKVLVLCQWKLLTWWLLKYNVSMKSTHIVAIKVHYVNEKYSHGGY